jgi:hypothetical protein
MKGPRPNRSLPRSMDRRVSATVFIQSVSRPKAARPEATENQTLGYCSVDGTVETEWRQGRSKNPNLRSFDRAARSRKASMQTGENTRYIRQSLGG